jgi:hypothetical protein
MENTPNTNNTSTHQNEETNVENLLSLIKDQTKELKINKKRLEKLEEKYIKTNADLKNVLNDKTNIENFLKTIFPKEMHDGLIKSEYGLYDQAELGKLFLVCESKKQNEFAQILNKYKNENLDLSEKNKYLSRELEAKTNELNEIKKNQSSNIDQLNFYQNNYNDVMKKLESLENEKNYLMKIIDEKNEEIENLISLEVENAELKAKSLLDNLDLGMNLNIYADKKTSNNTFGSGNIEGLGLGNNLLSSGFNTNTNLNNEKNLKICKILILKIFNLLVSLNVGCQTTEQWYSSEYVLNLEKQISDLKQKLERSKKDFVEYKDKSHKILLGSEENYNRLLKENESLKKEISDLLTKAENEEEKNTYHSENKPHNNQANAILMNEITNIKQTLNSINNIYKNDPLSSHTDEHGRVNLEYLKNVLIKYLEAIAIGNEFQIKILENVIFTVLNISNDERIKLEEKRARSSFYYNLWYNAKAFLSARIYGAGSDDVSQSQQGINTNVNNISTEINGQHQQG